MRRRTHERFLEKIIIEYESIPWMDTIEMKFHRNYWNWLNTFECECWPMTFAYSDCSHVLVRDAHIRVRIEIGVSLGRQPVVSNLKILTKILNSGANATQNTNTSIFDRPENKMKTKFATSFICSAQFASFFRCTRTTRFINDSNGRRIVGVLLLFACDAKARS